MLLVQDGSVRQRTSKIFIGEKNERRFYWRQSSVTGWRK
jgi:hypothetical protein